MLKCNFIIFLAPLWTLCKLGNSGARLRKFSRLCFVVDDDPSKKDLFNLNHRYGSAAVASALLLVTVDGSHHGKILELQVIHKCGLFHTHLHEKCFLNDFKKFVCLFVCSRVV